MIKLVKSASLVATLALAPFAASAATVDVSVGAPDSSTTNLILAGGQNQTATFNYTFTKDLTVLEFLFGAQGTNDGQDTSNVTYSFGDGEQMNFDRIDNGITSEARSRITANRSFAKDDTLTVNFFGNGNQNDVSVASSLVTELNAVPVPASSLLLLSAIGGAGFVARRRKKKSA